MRRFAALAVHLLAALVVLVTLTAFALSVDWWFVRVWDYPRLQLFVAALVLAAAVGALRFRKHRTVSYTLLVLTLSAAAVQGGRIAPYTPLWATQTKTARPGEGTPLTLLVANVLMDNRHADRLLAQAQTSHADLLVFTEPDAWWAAQLQPLHAAYPYRVSVPLPNTYGMIVMSRLPLESPKVAYLFEPGIPSVHTAIQLGGQRVALHFVHPKPPAPGEATRTTARDAELLTVGKQVRAQGGPAIIAGDMNDVAWSGTTRLFQRVSGMLDPRRGRGLYSTFNAQSAWLRWPLDHVFHTEHFTFARVDVLGANGSDHFPFLVTLRLSPAAPARQNRPDPDSDDHEDAQEQIDDARQE